MANLNLPFNKIQSLKFITDQNKNEVLLQEQFGL